MARKPTYEELEQRVNEKGQNLRARAKTTYHFGIPASGYLWPIVIRKTLEIACYSCGFAQSDRPNLTQI